MKYLGFIGLMLGSCAAPCELATVLSAYEAESHACVRHSETEAEARACVLEVQKRYLPRLADLGEEAAKELQELADE